MKKLVMSFILGMMIVGTTVMGYGTITYIMEKTISHEVTVGTTDIIEDGLLVTLATYDDYELTFHSIAETATEKHYITYTYNYDILVQGYDITVSSITDDIIIDSIVYGETIDITFGLNQEKTFTTGQVITIQFHFELTQITLGIYSASNPINFNTTTQEELESIGLNSYQAGRVIEVGALFQYISLEHVDELTGLNTFVVNYQYYEDIGIIVFEWERA